MIEGFKDVLLGSKKNPYADEEMQQLDLEQQTIDIRLKVKRNIENLKDIDSSPTFIRIGEDRSVEDRIMHVEDTLRN